ncbi:heme acquisition protein HasA [Hahella ganghwensis]|uniref:heme acquisition protein HasA n=1 Tax=Hahella ganghwensis TaxID=286420 RepID=UPI00037079FC|nr:heme acquisition protein HasA [Hahella ganghwensis]
MAITVTYGDTFYDYDNATPVSWADLDSFFTAYESHFDVADHSENPGAFAGQEDPDPVVDTGIWGNIFGPFSGTQYVLEGEADGLDLGFIVEAADGSYLNYTFFSGPSHTMYGEIASITFGSGLEQDSTTGEYSFSEELVSIDGLNSIGLNGGLDANGDVIGRNTGNNDTHNLINALKDGDASDLVNILADNGYTEANQLAEILGVAETTESELAFAA